MLLHSISVVYVHVLSLVADFYAMFLTKHKQFDELDAIHFDKNFCSNIYCCLHSRMHFVQNIIKLFHLSMK